MSTVLDVIGRPIEVTNNQVCVSATDKMLSGWGKAQGRTHKQIVICHNRQQAEKVADNMRRSSFSYVNVRYGIPYYPSTRYTISYHDADDCPLWNK
jgi:hypothetical protein